MVRQTDRQTEKRSQKAQRSLLRNAC